MNLLGRLFRIGIGFLSPHSVVFYYHRVADVEHDWNALAIVPSEFERHLQLMRRLFKVVPLNEIGQARSRGKRCAAITFDDGYADNAFIAAPLLEKYELPATFFLTTDFVAGKRMLMHDELQMILTADGGGRKERRIVFGDCELDVCYGSPLDPAVRQCYRKLHNVLQRACTSDREQILDILSQGRRFPQEKNLSQLAMTWQQARALQKSKFIQFGAHTRSHPWLGAESAAVISTEIAGSRCDIEDNLGVRPDCLAYPYGTRECVTPLVEALASGAGFAAAYTTVRERLMAQENAMRCSRHLMKSGRAEVLRQLFASRR